MAGDDCRVLGGGAAFRSSAGNAVRSSLSIAGVVATGVVVATIARRRGLHRANAWSAYSILAVLTGGMLYGRCGAHLRRRASQDRSAGPADLGDHSLGDEHHRVRIALLAARCRRTECARTARSAHRGGVSLSADEPTTRPEPKVSRSPKRRGGVPTSSTTCSSRSTPAPRSHRPMRPCLSKWAKVAMMIQAIISFTTVVLIGARAVNIL